MSYCGCCGTALQGDIDGNGERRKVCPACGWAWYDPPVPVTLVLVTTDDGRVVYCRKKHFEPGRWSVVSGFIPRGERAEDTAVREVREETGLEVEIVRYMGTHVYDRQPDQVVIAFQARVIGGELRPGSDVDEVELAPPDVTRLRDGSTSQLLVRRLTEDPTLLGRSTAAEGSRAAR